MIFSDSAILAAPAWIPRGLTMMPPSAPVSRILYARAATRSWLWREVVYLRHSTRTIASSGEDRIPFPSISQRVPERPPSRICLPSTRSSPRASAN